MKLKQALAPAHIHCWKFAVCVLLGSTRTRKHRHLASTVQLVGTQRLQVRACAMLVKLGLTRQLWVLHLAQHARMGGTLPLDRLNAWCAQLVKSILTATHRHHAVGAWQVSTQERG